MHKQIHLKFAMKDLLNNDINIGDKIAFLPHKEWKPTNLQYGIITHMTKDNTACYCKSLNEENRSEILRFSHQVIKLH